MGKVIILDEVPLRVNIPKPLHEAIMRRCGKQLKVLRAFVEDALWEALRDGPSETA